MPKEIERKFLVLSDEWKNKAPKVLYYQGYLSTGSAATVRIRVVGELAVLTIKGKTINASREEYEYEIPLDEAKQMLDSLAVKPFIKKYRYTFEELGHTWEVDEFIGDNKGLIVAEVELANEDEQVELPSWVGLEVTGDAKYYNSQLVKHPFSEWPKVNQSKN